MKLTYPCIESIFGRLSRFGAAVAQAVTTACQ